MTMNNFHGHHVISQMFRFLHCRMFFSSSSFLLKYLRSLFTPIPERIVNIEVMSMLKISHLARQIYDVFCIVLLFAKTIRSKYVCTCTELVSSNIGKRPEIHINMREIEMVSRMVCCCKQRMKNNTHEFQCMQQPLIVSNCSNDCDWIETSISD
jgi:hypothetical protein